MNYQTPHIYETEGCPSCGSTDVKVTIQNHKFPHGESPSIQLEASMPVADCKACGGSFYGDEGARAIGVAVREHYRKEARKDNGYNG